MECLAIKSVLHNVNSHTGKDYYSHDEADVHFKFCAEFEQTHNLTVNHETVCCLCLLIFILSWVCSFLFIRLLTG